MTTRLANGPLSRHRTAGARLGRTRGLRHDLRELARFREVVLNIVVQELRVRYQRSVLGFFWTLLNPILMMLTLTVVFAQLLNRGATDYALNLFAGMVPWGLLAGTLNDCAFCIILNEGLIRKIYLPKLVFPLSRLFVNLTMVVFSMGALFLMLLPLGARLSPAMIVLPLVLALFAAFALGLGLIVATANTFYRDCSHLVAVFLQAWYFATPILYPIQQFAPDARWRFWLNPAYPFIRMFQTILHEGQWPELMTFALALVIAATTLALGYVTFKAHEDKLIFRL